MQNEYKKIVLDLKETLNLPRTEFPIRAQTVSEDPIILTMWHKEDLYKKSTEKNFGNEKFILHDGPPYANGHLHLGHALNKILKDIITKYKRMSGHHTPVIPGWDCHGLPIELKVSKENQNISRAALISECRKTANEWIQIQMNEFKNLGICMAFDTPYKTMDFHYESTIMKAFASLLENGYIQRKEKTVPWCTSCQTVLAAAEIEYSEKKDPSLYVLFDVTEETKKYLYEDETNKTISVLVWTTTPWTLPLNQAVIAKPDTNYTLLDIDNNLILIGEALVDSVLSITKKEKKILKTIHSSLFLKHKIHVKNPLFNKIVPIIFDNSVELSSGTAFVHCAPGAGPIDYDIGIQNNLSIYSPISINGTFTHESTIKEMISLNITEANTYVIEQLKKNNHLYALKTIAHSFPHCWRCHSSLLFRTTKQWFCDLSHKNLKTRALSAIKKLTMLPESSKNRFLGTIDSRLEWCLSRQRTWGVPIPALICISCDFVFTNEKFINKIASFTEKEGVEFWDSLEINTIIEASYPCIQCGKITWKKELDILDVWFDSGISSFAVLKDAINLSYPADMYIEGKDQHRGWFQSSLLLSLALSDSEIPCMKTILTHGFTVDENGHKMSKSKGNVISPDQMIEKLSRDGLRLWVASIDYTDDAVISEKVFTAISESFRKIRNTCRFLLSNIYDFNNEQDRISFNELLLIDQYILKEFFEVYYTTIQAYEAYDFARVFRTVTDFCVTTLSSLYLDLSKDRLYVENINSLKRRSAQTVYYVILDGLVKLMAPIMSFTMEKIKDHYQKNISTSIHLQDLPTLYNLAIDLIQYFNCNISIQSNKNTENGLIKDVLSFMNTLCKKLYDEKEWDFIKQLRSEILKSIEAQREIGTIKHSLEATVSLYIDITALTDEQKINFKKWQTKAISEIKQSEFFKELLIVSEFKMQTNSIGLTESTIKGVFISTLRANGVKCPRCWHWNNSQHQDLLCKRCENIIQTNFPL